MKACTFTSSQVLRPTAMFVLAAILGCNRQGGEPRPEPKREDVAASQKVVRLSETEMKEFNVELGTAGPGKLRIEVALPGEVTQHADRVAHVVARFAGMVKDVRREIGDAVRKDEVLAVVEANDSLKAYDLKSPLDGTVIERHMVRGEIVKDETHAFVVADLSSVWVNLRIYQKDLATVRKGQLVIISAGHGVAEGKGEISYVAPTVDEKTRTGLARVVLPNPDGSWRPGLFVTARVTVDEAEAPVVVAKSALQTIDWQSCVFVETAKGFAMRPVTVGRTNEHEVEVTWGLSAGERYVTKGAFTLKAELAKAAFGDEHGH